MSRKYEQTDTAGLVKGSRSKYFGYGNLKYLLLVWKSIVHFTQVVYKMSYQECRFPIISNYFQISALPAYTSNRLHRNDNVLFITVHKI